MTMTSHVSLRFMFKFLVFVGAVDIGVHVWSFYQRDGGGGRGGSGDRASPQLNTPAQLSTTVKSFDMNDLQISRDFLRYDCVNTKRLGGHKSTAWNLLPNDLYRVEGAWFVCFDEGLAPINGSCTLLSFGVNDDESFDRYMSSSHGCQVESFDPFVEIPFRHMRESNPALKNAVTLQVSPNWRFHRIGIVDAASVVGNETSIGWLATFDQILAYTSLNEKTIDILKIDIEMAEWRVFDEFDVNYLCAHVKQIMFETHTAYLFPNVATDPERHLFILRKLEKCFRLIRRDTRFFREFTVNQYGFQKTEFQEPITYKIDLAEFKSEEKLIDFLVTYGELYFVNINFKL